MRIPYFSLFLEDLRVSTVQKQNSIGFDPIARQTSAFMPGKNSADGRAVHALAFSAGFSATMPTMKRIQAFKFRLVPTLEQERLLSRHAGCVRFVWNKALDLQKKCLDAGIPLLSCGDLAKLLTLWRASEEYGFLANGPSQPQQQTLRNLDRALWDALTGKRGFPRFKRKGEGDSLRYPDPLQVKLDLATRDAEGRNLLPRIFLPKEGPGRPPDGRSGRSPDSTAPSCRRDGERSCPCWNTGWNGMEAAWSGSIPGTPPGPVSPADTCRRRAGRISPRSGASPAIIATMRTRTPRKIYSGRGTPAAPVRGIRPPNRRPDRSGRPIHPRLQKGSWQEGEDVNRVTPPRVSTPGPGR